MTIKWKKRSKPIQKDYTLPTIGVAIVIWLYAIMMLAPMVVDFLRGFVE